MLKVKSLVKKFGEGKEVLRGISFSINPGEVVGFLGPNGAGKTTTISIISGVLEPTSGSVIVGGRDIVSETMECKKIISVVPENQWLWERLSAVEYLSFIGSIRRMSPEEIRERAYFLLGKFSLLKEADRLIESFSYGMKQKLLWCAALLKIPRLLLLDEPFTGLDPQALAVARSFIYEITKAGDKGYQTAVLVSTHNLSIAEKICSRIIVINKGEILADEKTESLREKFLNSAAVRRNQEDALPSSALESAFFGIINESDV